MTTILMKQSPLSGHYANYNAQTIEIAGWQIARNFGNEQKEKDSLANASILVDWSHVGKISIRGSDAADRIAELFPQAASLKPLQSFANESVAILCLTDDEYLLLTAPGEQTKIIEKCKNTESNLIDVTGGMGCLVLAGPRRDEVTERSSAMNLRRDRVGAGAVIQTTIHAVHTTLWRTECFDVILVSRDYTEFLFDALLDVGQPVGLLPAGLFALAVPFISGQ